MTDAQQLGIMLIGTVIYLTYLTIIGITAVRLDEKHDIDASLFFIGVGILLPTLILGVILLL